MSLVEAFGPAPGLDPASLERELRRVCAVGRAAWPDVALDDAVFVAHVAARIGETDVADALAALHAADLYLACAASRGVPRAVQALRADLVANLPAWLASMRLDADKKDEVTQAVVTRLLVPRADGGPPRVADYQGRGPLGGWMRVTAVRTALGLRSGERPQDVPLDTAPRMLGPAGVDVELDVIRQLHRDDFAEAFRASLEALDARDRTLLGMYWLDEVPTTRLGALHGVHRTTVARWLEEAQEKLLVGTRARLAGRLGLSPEEAGSLIQLLRSRLDVSLRVLRDRG